MALQSPSLRDSALFAGILLALLLLLSTLAGLRRLDAAIYDGLLALTPVPLRQDLAILAIDEASLAELGQWPWRRDVHARLLQSLRTQGVRALVFDVLFTEPDRHHPDADSILAGAMAESGMVFLPLHIDQLHAGAPPSEILPLPALSQSAAGLGHAHVELGPDGVARGFYLYQGMGQAAWPALALTLAQALDPAAATPVRSALGPGDGWLQVRDQFRLIPFAGGTGTVPTYSYVDALEGRLPENSLRDRILFVGATAAGFGDLLPIPFSGWLGPMPGVEIHAHIYNGLSHAGLIRVLPRPWGLLLAAVFALLPALAFPRLPPERTLPLTLLLLLALLASSYGLLAWARLWFEPGAALLTLLLAYPLWSWRRLIRLDRFLGQELQRLSREPTLNVIQDGETPQLWFRQLVELLQPPAHALWIDRVLTEGTKPDVEPPKAVQSEHYWIEHGGYWWRVMQINGHRYRMALQWPEELAHEPDPGRVLTGLEARRQGSRAAVLHPIERLERRIEQVRSAISAMRSMRRFIGNSLEHMADGILVTDRLGRVLFANAHCRAWLRPPATGQTLNGPGTLAAWLEPYPSPDVRNWPELIRAVLIDGQEVSATFRLRDREILVHMVPLAGSESHDRGLIASFTDISPIREQQRRQLETIDFISHDLRAPLVSQLALFEQLLDRADETQREQLLQARRHTEKSLTLADRFLQLTRVEAAEQIALHDCDLLAVLENAIDQVEPQARAKGIRIQIADDAEEVWLLANGELMERVALNLLTNAVKYSPPQSQIEARVWQDQEGAWLSVRDQGQGIPEHLVARIFDRHRQLPSMEGQRVTSAGLGLRFISTVVARHQGRVLVDSAPGQGTCIQICLPLPPSPPSEA